MLQISQRLVLKMSKLKLVEVEEENPRVPSEVIAFAEDKEAYRKSYQGVTHVTDAIKQALLKELNEKLFPTSDAVGDGVSQADRLGYIRGLRKAIRFLP